MGVNIQLVCRRRDAHPTTSAICDRCGALPTRQLRTSLFILEQSLSHLRSSLGRFGDGFNRRQLFSLLLLNFLLLVPFPVALDSAIILFYFPDLHFVVLVSPRWSIREFEYDCQPDERCEANAGSPTVLPARGGLFAIRRALVACEYERRPDDIGEPGAESAP